MLTHFADLADIDILAGLLHVLDHQLFGADETAVLARQPHRLAAMLVDQVDDFLVDRATQHHFDDVHGLPVGDAHALDEFALLADPLQQVVDLRPTAMHHHRVHADQLEQHHVLGEALLEVLLGHGVAAVLDDDGLVLEAPDIGQRFGKDGGFFFCGGCAQWHGWSLSPRVIIGLF